MSNRELYVIAYDLNQPGQDYSTLYESIKDLAGEGNWQHPLESVWVVRFRNNKDVGEIFDILHEKMDDNDSLFIVKITDQPRQGWLPKSFWEWMKEESI